MLNAYAMFVQRFQMAPLHDRVLIRPFEEEQVITHEFAVVCMLIARLLPISDLAAKAAFSMLVSLCLPAVCLSKHRKLLLVSCCPRAPPRPTLTLTSAR